MGKCTKKLVVYLDQNFLSEMSKAAINERVRTEFRDIYEILHQGFVDEKLVVPCSVLHDIESSLATHLKERIRTCQQNLGQVRLYRPDEIKSKQSFAALDRYMGRISEDPLRPKSAFLDHPDQRVKSLGISIDAHLEYRNFRAGRHSTARQLEALRQMILQQRTTYEAQVKTEQKSQRDEFIQMYVGFCGPIPEEKMRELTEFTESDVFKRIPLLRIEAQLFASILTRKPDRQIKASDGTDIDALSAYAPYMDVVCTDAFMADQLRNVGTEYGFKLFSAKTSSLRELKAYLESYLSCAAPIRRPSITAFVLPPKERREESANFFRQLGAALHAMGTLEYGEIYAFDDGAMPKYELRQAPGKPVPFYGLQDVTKIDLPAGAHEEQIIKMCRKRCRSDHFVFIDEYKDINDTFMLSAAMSAEANMNSTSGYRLFRTRAA